MAEFSTLLRLCMFALAIVFASIGLASTAPAADAAPPNIVLILADDLGWADLGCYGADLHETPHLDRLARQGVRFTDAYAASVCSPTRAALLTGKHYARLHITIWREAAQKPVANRKLSPPVVEENLPQSEVTLAERLQAAGYLTAIIGKWHLGGADHYPETQGFDVNVGGTHWGAPFSYFFPYRGAGRFGGEFRYVPHLELGKPGEYLTDRLTDEALRRHRCRGREAVFFVPGAPRGAYADRSETRVGRQIPGQAHRGWRIRMPGMQPCSTASTRASDGCSIVSTKRGSQTAPS